MFCFIIVTSSPSDAAMLDYCFVFSSRTLKPNEKFEVQLKDMAWGWSGALEVGVTTFDPGDISQELPSTMTCMKSGTWMLVGETVIHKNHIIKKDYCGMRSLGVSIQ
jgi:hypothetical protein